MMAVYVFVFLYDSYLHALLFYMYMYLVALPLGEVGVLTRGAWCLGQITHRMQCFMASQQFYVYNGMAAVDDGGWQKTWAYLHCIYMNVSYFIFPCSC